MKTYIMGTDENCDTKAVLNCLAKAILTAKCFHREIRKKKKNIWLSL